MVNSSKYLFAFDLDGTLVHNLPSGERTVPPRLLDCVRRLGRHAHVMVATGRRYRTALPIISLLPAASYSVTNNGMVVKDASGKTIHRESLDRADALSIAKLFHKTHLDVIFATDGYHENIDFIFWKQALKEADAPRKLFERFHEVSAVVETMEDVLSFRRDIPLLEVATLGPYHELLEARELIEPQLPKPYRAVVVKGIGEDSWGALEIFSGKVSKWTGILSVKKLLNVEMVVAVGDDENDIEMLQSADISVVMSHAQPHVKRVASRDVEGPEGLAQYLEEWIERLEQE